MTYSMGEEGQDRMEEQNSIVTAVVAGEKDLGDYDFLLAGVDRNDKHVPQK